MTFAFRVLAIRYGYGVDGYKDVRFSSSVASAYSKIVTGMKFTGDVAKVNINSIVRMNGLRCAVTPLLRAKVN